MKKYLVFVRAGSKTLHRQAIADDPQRNWDCFVSWYAPPPPGAAPEEFQADGFDNKCEAFVDAYERTLRGKGYSHFLMLDDDVKFKPGDISRFFEWCERAQIDQAHPALRWRTYVNFPVTMRNPVCHVRRVGWVEIMSPCFSARVMDVVLPLLTLTKSTWGVDFACAHEVARVGGVTAMVDAIAVEHTKPADVANGPFYQKLMAMGIDAQQELDRVLERFPRKGWQKAHDQGHLYAWPLPASLNRSLMWAVEKFKKRFWQRVIKRKPPIPVVSGVMK